MTPPRILVDVQGTVVGNAHHSPSVCLQALQDLQDADYTVILVSSEPGGKCYGAHVESKQDWLVTERCRGAIWVDDDDALLRVAVRLGAAAFPAEMLPTLAAMLKGVSRE